jgi:hypothetical protein
MKINNIDGITVSKIRETVNLSQSAIKATLKKEGIFPIGYIGSAAVYPATSLKVVKERNRRRGRPPKGADLVSK